MKILAVSYDIPYPDQSSGELRFFTLLSLLARTHEITFYSEDMTITTELDAAAQALSDLGVRIENGTFEHLLRRESFDIVFFEFYFVAEGLLEFVRAWQPRARVVVDSVDVHFHRLRSKAHLTGLRSDREHAEVIKRSELTVYRQADLVLTVSEEDSRVLRNEGLRNEIDVIPNIHAILPLAPHQWGDRLELIFIGCYKWAPNIDAMIYFCREMLPLLRQTVPQFRLRIIGSAPTDEVKALAADDVQVVGFVPETTPLLLSSDISIAPLRYGGGIKGKIGEAMAHGLPVVSTSIGIEGFGFRIGEDVLACDTPQAFVDAIAILWQDRNRYETVRRNGWNFINDRYSEQAAECLIAPILDGLVARPPKRMSVVKRIKMLAPHYLDKYVLWRLKA
ncbi:glycosyltransferase family 4 protein [Candidatus Nitrotoga arctica]|uniref:Glycosyltransferase involved in cell wall bisynthesis n=1 Tax=Candidatus Nitrotoga arctica TaxID=453162 RepID=A0ABN8AMC6_9PROT|nr:glycosyltransferase family 4 protein [Candidatus Nitrotoga arctica]CAG9932792.1 Glycosyltransferase involved in cell wall bisynthesis [Candidatus Nitrotoga arctica]